MGPRTLHAFLVLLFLAADALALSPLAHWRKGAGGLGPDRVYAVCVDAGGNTIAAGGINGVTDFGGGAHTPAGGYDIFVVKYDAAGDHLWSKHFGDTGNDVAYAVTTDPSGNVYLAGTFEDRLRIDFQDYFSAGVTDIFLSCFDPTGNHLWTRAMGAANIDGANGLAVDAAGDVFLAGYFEDSVDFGGGLLVSAGGADAFLAKYGSAGTHLWSQRFGGTSSDYAHGVAVNSVGEPAITGRFLGTADFGGDPLVGAGSNDIFLAQYDAAGTHQWSQRFGSSSGDVGNSIAFAPSGDLFLTGTFQNTVDFGGGGLSAVGGADILLVRFDAHGNHRFSRSFGGSSGDIGESVAVDSTGNVLLAGSFRGTVNFGGEDLSAGATNTDAFLAKFDGDLQHRFSHDFGSSGTDLAKSVALTPSNDFVCTGYFNGTVDFAGANLTSAGGDDIFLLRLTDPAQPLITSILDIGNDQGGRVKIRFARSGYDNALAATPVQSYQIFREDSASAAAQKAWNLVAVVAAHAETGYGIDVTTLGDSTVTAGDFQSRFYVHAATVSPILFYDSAVDSGYSLDNLIPGVPTGLKWQGDTLIWIASSAADLAHYTVYGAQSEGASEAYVVDYVTDVSLDLAAAGYSHYAVSATDRAGNESARAWLKSPLSQQQPPTHWVLSLSSFPNPFNPRTSLQYTVPADGEVTIAIYDARGQRIVTLLDAAPHVAGAYSVSWDGSGSASGVYFAHIHQGKAGKSKKLLLVQ